jgi:methylated-DNA-protein-cysteine methyltransferase related protein
MRRARSGVSRGSQADRSDRTRRAGFFDSVYAMVRRIPRGKVATYGQIARLVGAPRSARVVGWAMHGNPHGARVPWQRVVQRGGSLSETVCPADPDRQRRLLAREGVTFLLDGRIDMAVHQWAPDSGDLRRASRSGATVFPS